MIIESINKKIFKSEKYNYVFNKENGEFFRWGENLDDNPLFAPGPEILDLEISTGGSCLGNCSFCYKSNGGSKPTYNMSFENFKIIFNKLPKTLTQIAFGIMNINTNPDFFEMMRYSRLNGVVPNYTCHGLDVTNEIAEKTAEICGAVAVSIVNKEKSFDSIKKFTDAGIKQVNIHYMLSNETYDKAFEIINDISTDQRLKKLYAIVFLQLKKKGRANSKFFNYLNSIKKYKILIDYARSKNINIGFDSCSAPMYFKSVEGTQYSEEAKISVEPCESTLFSAYINYEGKFFPCSFSEGIGEWKEGLDVLHSNDFLKDIWFNEKTNRFRESLLKSSKLCTKCEFNNVCRSCPIYKELTICKT